MTIALLIGGAALVSTITNAVDAFEHNNVTITQLNDAINGR